MKRLPSRHLAFFRRYGQYSENMWGLILQEPTPGTYTIEPGIERRESRRWHILELTGLVDAGEAYRALTPWMDQIVRVEVGGLFISSPPHNGGLAFNATTDRSHIFFNFESGTEERVMQTTVQAMEQVRDCRFFYQRS